MSARLDSPFRPELVTKDQILAAFPDAPDPEGWARAVESAWVKAKGNLLEKSASENWKPWSTSATGKRKASRWWEGSAELIEQVIQTLEEQAIKRHQHPVRVEQFICDQVEQLCHRTYLETLAPNFAGDRAAIAAAQMANNDLRPFRVPVIELRSSSGRRVVLEGWRFFYLTHFVSYAKERLKQGRQAVLIRVSEAYVASLEGKLLEGKPLEDKPIGPTEKPKSERMVRSVAASAAGVAKVKEAIRKLGIAEFCKRAEVSEGTLRTFLKRKPVSFSNFKSIAKAAGLTPEQLQAD